MSATVEALATKLKEKNYVVSDRVVVVCNKTVFFGFKKFKEFDINDKEAIDDFYTKYGPITSIHFTSYSGNDITYEPKKTEKGKWLLNYVRVPLHLISGEEIKKLQDIIEIPI
jgi:hypothetical protein